MIMIITLKLIKAPVGWEGVGSMQYHTTTITITTTTTNNNHYYYDNTINSNNNNTNNSYRGPCGLGGSRQHAGHPSLGLSSAGFRSRV